MEYFVFVVGLYFMSLRELAGLQIPFGDNFHTERTRVEFLSVDRVDRARRDTLLIGSSFPDKTLVKFRVGGNLHEIYLEKNGFIDLKNIPVFLSRNGTTTRSYVLLKEEHALYQAADIGGSFLLTRQNTSRERHVFGTFQHNATLYVIQPSSDSDVRGEDHIVSRVPDQELVFESLSHRGVSRPSLHQDDISSYHSNGFQAPRRTRRETKVYNVEVLSVVDYRSYKFWYDMTSGTSRHSDAVQQVMQYLAYIINSVDTRYKSMTGDDFAFNILSAGVYIADTAQASPWSENNVADGVVSSSAILQSFTEWVKQQNSLPQFDHAMGFTGYDVVRIDTGDSSGIAYTESLCTTESTSIVQDNSFNFVTMTTASHELGHSLGAKHDGIDNSCDGNDNFIMSSVNRVVNDPVLGQNLWKFSACSVSEFKGYISRLDRDSNNCMLQTSSFSNVPTTQRPMAETYGPDETCVLRFGQGSYVCRSVQNYETICTGMFCNQPGTTNCFSTLPAEGTPCGKGKWCQQGRCVSSSLAPRNNEDNCALGNRPGLFDDTGETCTQIVDSDPAKCYGDYTGANCCESCNTKRTGDATCEFGDHGVSFCTTMERQQCYYNEEYCCSTCKQLKNSSLPGCEYGDRFIGCDKNSCRFYNAENLAGCCETCETVTPVTTTTTTTKSTPTTTTTSPTTTTTVLTTKTTTPSTTTTTTTQTTRTTRSPSTTTKPAPTSTSTTRKPTPSASTTHPTEKTDISSQTTKVTITPRDTTSDIFTSTQTSPEEKVSDIILVGVGCAVGAVVVIILVIVLCLCLRRRKTKMENANAGRKASNGNAYDNIGFVSAVVEKPSHPPPRRGSNLSSANSTSNRSVNPPVSTVSNGSIEHADGYMMPATLHITTPDGVQYSAPNKPKFKPLVPPNKPKKKAFSAPKPSPDLNKQRASKPIHYKRTSGMSNSSTDTLGKTSSIHSSVEYGETVETFPDGYDSIGDVQKIPQSRRPTLPENHPGTLNEAQNFKSKKADIDDKNTNDNNLNGVLKFGRHTSSATGENSFDKRKVLPTLPPRPVPRIKPKYKGKFTDSNSNDISETGKSFHESKGSEGGNINSGYEEMDNVKRVVDVNNPSMPPTKPVPRRQISSEDKPALPQKKALRPPTKPVPRRRTSSDTTEDGHLNVAFSNEQVEIQI